MSSFRDYKNHCYNVGDKAGRYDTLHNFVEKVKANDLVKCDVCGEYVPIEYTHQARYDIDKVVCEGCRKDGN